MANELPISMYSVWYVRFIPSDEQCFSFSNVQNYYLLTMKSPHDLFTCFVFIYTVTQITS